MNTRKPFCCFDGYFDFLLFRDIRLDYYCERCQKDWNQKSQHEILRNADVNDEKASLSSFGNCIKVNSQYHIIASSIFDLTQHFDCYQLLHNPNQHFTTMIQLTILLSIAILRVSLEAIIQIDIATYFHFIRVYDVFSCDINDK